MHELLMEVDFRVHVLNSGIERTHNPDYGPGFDLRLDADCRTELLIIEETDPLKPKAREQLGGYLDRNDVGPILIGRPGFDRQLDTADVPSVPAPSWTELGPTVNPAHPPTVKQPWPSPASPVASSASSDDSRARSPGS